MFKKIEVWILYLCFILFLIVLVLFSSLLKYFQEGGKKLIFLKPLVYFVADIPFNTKKILRPENQYSLQTFSNKDFLKKLKEFKKEKPYLLLVSRFDGDLNKSIIEIRNLNNFDLIYKFDKNINELIDLTDFSKEEFKVIKKNLTLKRYHFWNPVIDKEGSFYFHSGSPLIKTDFCGNVIWINNEDRFHHSINLDNSFIWVPSRIFPHSIDNKLVGKNPSDFNDDAITKIDSKTGKIIFQKSVSKILIENGMQNILFSSEVFTKNPIHLNDIEPVRKDGLFWKRGDVFLSLRNQSMILLYRPSTNKIIHKITGEFYNQHDVDIIDSKTISLFNNNAKSSVNGLIVDGNSEVLFYDFSERKFSKKFEKSLKKNYVSTATHGLSETLKDGSLLIEDRNNGRILMFNSDGELIWEFVNNYNGKVFNLWWSRVLFDDQIRNAILEKASNLKC